MKTQVQDETQEASYEGSEDGEKGQEGFTLAQALKTLDDNSQATSIDLCIYALQRQKQKRDRSDKCLKTKYADN